MLAETRSAGISEAVAVTVCTYINHEHHLEGRKYSPLEDKPGYMSAWR